MDFHSLTTPALAQALADNGITTPTSIQSESIPIIKTGRDLAAASPTGTGKTLAYLLPLFERVAPEIKPPQAVVLTPTHELAAQVYKAAQPLSSASGIKTALLVGGASMSRQIERLKEKPRIVIGSAGRIAELIRQKKLSMHYVRTIVLDEADRLLDELNYKSVEAVASRALRDRQLLFFSASMAAQVLTRIKSMANDLEIIDGGLSLPRGIEHIYFTCDAREKINILRKLVHSAGFTRAIAFLNNPEAIENMTKRLNHHGIRASALHGEAFKDERKRALAEFADGRAAVLVASDIAARGLDIQGVSHIINLEVPDDPVFYLHRAGRTGRMGNSGVAVTIASGHELSRLRKCEKRLGFTAMHKEMRFGEVTDYSSRQERGSKRKGSVK